MVRAISVIAVLAVIALSAVVQPPVVSRSPLVRAPQPAVALTALTQPLAASSTLASPMPPQDPLTQQISFHVAFVGDFLATGAALFALEFAIPGALLQDIQRGTPIPDALGRALVDFAQVELDAGRELVRFAVQYASFQIGFVANILRDVITFVMAIPTAVGEFLGSLARPTPVTEPSAPAPALSISAARSSQTPTTDTTQPSTSAPALATPSSNDDVRNTGANTTPKKPKDVVAAEDSTTTATANPQDKAKSVTSETGQTDRTSAVDRAPDAHQTATHEPPRKHDPTADASDRKDEPTSSKQGDSVR